MQLAIKRLNILLLLFIYFLGTFQIAIPYLVYLVNYDYIVENMCEQRDEVENQCLGSCYLNDQLEQKINEMQNKPGNEESRNVLLTLSIHFANEEMELQNLCSLYRYNDGDTFDFSFIQNDIPSPPPRFC